MANLPLHDKSDPEIKFVTPDNDEFYEACLYKDLSVDNEEIRLLQLLPGSFTSQICCELVHDVFLAQPEHEYVALSYCAGDPRVTERILVNGHPFNVFRNLGLALRKIRTETQPILIWIDQICINQKNTAEREQQVLIMRSIYEGAEKTIAWLGEDAESNTEGSAVKFLKFLCERARVRTTQTTSYRMEREALCKFFDLVRLQDPDTWVPNDTPESPSFRSMVFNERLLLEQGNLLFEEIQKGQHKDALSAVITLYAMPYWTRCWVFQEVIVSKATDVIYGTLVIDFEAFRVANAILTVACNETLKSIIPHEDLGLAFLDAFEHSKAMLSAIPYVQDVNRFFSLEEKYKTQGRLELRQVINVSRERASTDPRDRIYAMLGLINQAYGIKPSYSNTFTVAETFISVTKAAIQVDGILDILADGQEMHRNAALDLPSWVPDFSVGPNHLSMCNWEMCKLEWGKDNLPVNSGKSEFAASRHVFNDEKPIIPGIPLPKFLPDASGRPDRVLRCSVLGLGFLALENTIEDVPDTWNLDSVYTLRYEKILSNAGLEGIYPETIPPGVFGDDSNRPRTELHGCLLQTLGCGMHPGNAHFGDNNIGFEDFKMRKARFLDRYAHVTVQGAWRFFVTPEKIMGVAPAEAQYDDFLCLIFGASVPFVLRQLPNTAIDGNQRPRYKLIGPAYALGYMSGQAILQMLTGHRQNTIALIDIY